jgi:hypothetical protein
MICVTGTNRWWVPMLVDKCFPCFSSFHSHPEYSVTLLSFHECVSETLVPAYQITLHHIPEDAIIDTFLCTWNVNFMQRSVVRNILLLTENSSHQTENHLMLCSVLLSGSVIVTCFFTYFCRGRGLDRPVRYIFTTRISTENIFVAGFNTAGRPTYFTV